MNRLFAAIFSIIMLASCDQPKNYSDKKPEFNPQEFFKGKLDSWGVVRDLFGREIGRFHMVMTATWRGDSATLHEAFTFADGSSRERLWTIKKIDQHHYIGTAPDVAGEAKGEVYGSVLYWKYNIILPLAGGGQRQVVFDDWLYMVGKDTVFSLVKIRKFGIKVGEMTMFFKKS